MLKVGTIAPDITLGDQNGVTHALSDYRGSKVLLYFYPKDNTSGCTCQAKGYSALKEQFQEAGVQILAVSKDSVASHKRFEEKQQLTITLLSDEALTAIQAYDVWHEKKMAGRAYMGVVRTTYLIGEDGTILFASDKVKAASDAQTMLEKLK